MKATAARCTGAGGGSPFLREQLTLVERGRQTHGDAPARLAVQVLDLELQVAATGAADGAGQLDRRDSSVPDLVALEHRLV